MTFIPLSQAAEMVGPGIRPATLHTYREKGMLRCVKIGKEWRTTAAWVEEFKCRLASSSTAQKQTTGPSSPAGTGGLSTSSAGTKAGACGSDQRVSALIQELTAGRATPHGRQQRKRSAPISSPMPAPVAPVVPLQPRR